MCSITIGGEDVPTVRTREGTDYSTRLEGFMTSYLGIQTLSTGTPPKGSDFVSLPFTSTLQVKG